MHAATPGAGSVWGPHPHYAPDPEPMPKGRGKFLNGSMSYTSRWVLSQVHFAVSISFSPAVNGNWALSPRLCVFKMLRIKTGFQKRPPPAPQKMLKKRTLSTLQTNLLMLRVSGSRTELTRPLGWGSLASLGSK